MVLPPEITIVKTLISGHHCRKFCLLIRGSCFFRWLFHFNHLSISGGMLGAGHSSKGFSEHEEGFFGGYSKNQTTNA